MALIATSVYFLHANVVHLLFLCHLENSVDSFHVVGNVIIQLSTSFYPPTFIVVNLHQSVKHFLERVMKRLHTVLADYIRNRLHIEIRKSQLQSLLFIQLNIIDHKMRFNKKETTCTKKRIPFSTSSSAIAERPRCRVGQFWPKVEEDILQTI